MSKHVRVNVVEDYAELSRRGADFVVDELKTDPGLLMCVASGSSPLGMYRDLGARYREQPALFSKMRVAKLDEWGPLEADDPASCEFYVRQEVLEPLGVSADRYLTMAGDADDPARECGRYAQLLEQAGPVDVCVLGMGVNGHLGLNEPADFLEETVHVAELAKDSQSHGMLKDARRQPTHGLTMGIGDILRSRRILLLVSGASKREPMRRFLTRHITTKFPASLLWTHRDLTVVCDRVAYPGSPSEE